MGASMGAARQKCDKISENIDSNRDVKDLEGRQTSLRSTIYVCCMQMHIRACLNFIAHRMVLGN